MIKRNSLFILIMVIVLCLSGCNKTQPGQSSSSKSAAKDYVYSMQDLSGDENVYISQVIRNDKELYAYAYVWPEDGSNTRIEFYKVNEEGGLGEKIILQMEEDESYNSIQLDNDGNLYTIKNVYTQYDYEDTEVYEDAGVYDAQEVMDEYYLVKMSMDGKEIFSTNINEIPELAKIAEENGYFYVNDIIMDGESALYVSCMDCIVKFDMEGNFQKVIAAGDTPLNNANLIPLENGKIAAMVYTDTGLEVAYADMEAGTIGETSKIPGASYEYSFYAGIGYELYLVNTYGVYGYNIGDTDKKQLMSFIDSDFGFYNLYALTGINDKELVAMYDDSETGMSKIGKFTKVDPKDVKDKKIITLAMAYSDWSVRMAVVDYNKKSDDVRITIQDYASLYGSETDYNAGVTKLNTDIVSGKVPDIILLDNSMPIDSYINKGLFEDTIPYIEKDEELEMDNFMPNIVNAFSVDGKMYTLVPSYSIQTLAAKVADVGNEKGWTVKEAQQVLASKPAGTQFIGMVTRDEMLQYSMSMAGDQFIDWKTGKCSFNSTGFVEMLEFINSFPEVVDDTQYTDDYWNNYESQWREGKVLTSMINIGDFRNYNYTEKGTFGEKITLIGFPSAQGDGSVIIPNLRLAMSAKSRNKEEAWSFLRTFLTEEYQNDEDMWGLPLSMKRLDVMAEEATHKPSYIDDAGEKVEYDDTYYISGMEITIEPMTAQESAAFKEQLFDYHHVYNTNEDLLKIIQEEAAPYFAGQKKATDVADIIQSRIQIYVNENR